MAEEVARQAREQVRGELVALVRAVIDAASYEIGEQALALLKEHPQAGQLWRILNEQLDRILIHLVPYYQGLQRVTPEWCRRDFRLRNGDQSANDGIAIRAKARLKSPVCRPAR